MEEYKKKYLEYKIKYIELKKSIEKKNQIGGNLNEEMKAKLKVLRYYNKIPHGSILNISDEFLNNPQVEMQAIKEIDTLFRELSGTDGFSRDANRKEIIEKARIISPQDPVLEVPYIHQSLPNESTAFDVYWQIANDIIREKHDSQEYKIFYKRNERAGIKLISEAAEYAGISPRYVFYTPPPPFIRDADWTSPIGEEKQKIINDEFKDLKRAVFHPDKPRKPEIPALPVFPRQKLPMTHEEEADIEAIKALIKGAHPAAKRRQ